MQRPENLRTILEQQGQTQEKKINYSFEYKLEEKIKLVWLYN